MKTSIGDEDLAHLESFPQDRRAEILQRIQSLKPFETQALSGDHDCEKTLLRLRRDGFRLIDLQRLETAFHTVWYRRRLAFLGRRRTEVAMLMWELLDTGSATTFTTWRIRPHRCLRRGRKPLLYNGAQHESPRTESPKV